MIRWPWISRVAYDDLLAQLKDERVRTRRLMRTVVRMKVTGGIIPRSDQATRLAPRPVDRLQQIIDDNKHCRTRPAVRTACQNYLEKARSTGTPEDVIEKTLMKFANPLADTGDEDDDDDTIALVG